MREYLGPAELTVPRAGSLTDDVVTNARELPRRRRAEPRVGRRVDRRHRRRRSTSEVASRRQGPDRRRASRPATGSRCCPGPVTSGRCSTTPSGTPAPSPSRSTRPRRPSRSAGSWPTPAAVLVVAETAEHVERVESSALTAPTLTHRRCASTRAASTTLVSRRAARRHRRRARGPPRRLSRPTSPATLIYTSGTTGRPKGCVLTHGNFMFELGVATKILDDLFELDDASTLLFLPLAHVFARIIQVGCIKQRVRLGHTRPTSRTWSTTWRPSSRRSSWPCRGCSRRCSTPRASARPPTAAARSSTRRSTSPSPTARRSTAAGPDRSCARGTPLFDRLVYAKLRAALGGRTQYAVSGGAPLGERLAHFYPRHRRPGARGLRPDRDDRRAHRQPARRAAHRHGRTSRCPARLSGLPTTASCFSVVGRCSPATGRTTRPPNAAFDATDGSIPATSARSTTTASSESPGAKRRFWSPPAARMSPRRCSRTRSVRTA